MPRRLGHIPCTTMGSARWSHRFYDELLIEIAFTSSSQALSLGVETLDPKRMRWPIAVLASAVGAGWILSTGSYFSKRPIEDEPVASPGPAAQRPEFEAIADQVSQSKNMFVGRGSMDELLAALPASDPKTPDGRTLRSNLAQEL